MRQSWNDYEQTASKGPLHIVVKAIIALFIIGTVVSAIGYGLDWFREVAQVAQEEFGARELLVKYEWFKDTSAQLDKKVADIQVYAARLGSIAESYGNVPRKEWAKEDREQYNIWMSEVAGVKASYNSLAAEYNAQMAKFNWRFANAGELPKGADVPLPREFKPYTNE